MTYLIIQQPARVPFALAQSPLLFFMALLQVAHQLLVAQAAALSALAQEYDPASGSPALRSLEQALDIFDAATARGKIVVCGIGKLYKIANKVVATMNSLSIHAAGLHPQEALHGDLGIVREDHGDCLLLITASGSTPELLSLLPHIPESIPVVLLSCTPPSQSLLGVHPQVKAHLHAVLARELSEESVTGLPAPTISTTLSLALADAVCLALASRKLPELDKRRGAFGARHPGGAIGVAFSQTNSMALLKANDMLAWSGLTPGTSEDEMEVEVVGLNISKWSGNRDENELYRLMAVSDLVKRGDGKHVGVRDIRLALRAGGVESVWRLLE